MRARPWISGRWPKPPATWCFAADRIPVWNRIIYLAVIFVLYVALVFIAGLDARG